MKIADLDKGSGRVEMTVRQKSLGKNVRFLLPSLKLKQNAPGGGTLEQRLHAVFVEDFGGYTATSANLFGYWKDENGENSYGEHRQFTVAVSDGGGLEKLKLLLSRTAKEMQEECIYVEIAGEAVLIYGA